MQINSGVWLKSRCENTPVVSKSRIKMLFKSYYRHPVNVRSVHVCKIVCNSVCNCVFAIVCVQCVCNSVFAIVCLQQCVCNSVCAIVCVQVCVYNIVFAIVCIRVCVRLFVSMSFMNERGGGVKKFNLTVMATIQTNLQSRAATRGIKG